MVESYCFMCTERHPSLISPDCKHFKLILPESPPSLCYSDRSTQHRGPSRCGHGMLQDLHILASLLFFSLFMMFLGGELSEHQLARET